MGVPPQRNAFEVAPKFLIRRAGRGRSFNAVGDTSDSVSLLEAQRRIGDRWLMEAELRWLREAKNLSRYF